MTECNPSQKQGILSKEAEVAEAKLSLVKHKEAALRFVSFFVSLLVFPQEWSFMSNANKSSGIPQPSLFCWGQWAAWQMFSAGVTCSDGWVCHSQGSGRHQGNLVRDILVLQNVLLFVCLFCLGCFCPLVMLFPLTPLQHYVWLIYSWKILLEWAVKSLQTSCSPGGSYQAACKKWGAKVGCVCTPREQHQLLWALLCPCFGRVLWAGTVHFLLCSATQTSLELCMNFSCHFIHNAWVSWAKTLNCHRNQLS